MVNVTAAPAEVAAGHDYYFGTVVFDQPVYLDNNEQVTFDWTFAPLPFPRYQVGIVELFPANHQGDFASSLGDFALHYNGYIDFNPADGEATFFGRTVSDGAGQSPNPSGAPDLIGPITGFTYEFANIPEPSTWLLLMAGIALVGGALRQARSRAQALGRSA